MPLLILIFRAALVVALLAAWSACSDSASEQPSARPDDATPPGAQESPEQPSEPPASEPEPIPAERLEIGREAYGAGQCSMCHGPQGKGGGLGPDLTDGVWTHGDGSVEMIRQVLIEGVERGQMKDPRYAMAMPPVGRLIEDEDRILALAQYVWSLGNE